MIASQVSVNHRGFGNNLQLSQWPIINLSHGLALAIITGNNTAIFCEKPQAAYENRQSSRSYTFSHIISFNPLNKPIKCRHYFTILQEVIRLREVVTWQRQDGNPHWS